MKIEQLVEAFASEEEETVIICSAKTISDVKNELSNIADKENTANYVVENQPKEALLAKGIFFFAYCGKKFYLVDKKHSEEFYKKMLQS